MIRKSLVHIMVSLAILILLSGCASMLNVEYYSNENIDFAQGDDSHEISIRIQTRYAEHDSTAPFFRTLQSEFMSEHSNITIIDESINEELAYNNKLKLDIASGSIPDMFQIIGHANLLAYAKNGMILNVEDELKRDPEWANGFSQETINAWTLDGIDGVYGIPFSQGPEIMYYNKYLFEKAGIESVPKTWRDLQDCIEKLKKTDVIPWVVGGQETWRIGHIHNIIMHRWTGVEKSKAIGRREAKWTDPEVVETLQLYKDMYENDTFNKNLTTMTYLEEKELFFAGEAAMVFNGTWFIGEVKNSDMADQIGVFMFPYFEEKPQYLGDYTVYISGHQLNGRMQSPEKEAMIAFQKYISSREVQTRMVHEIGRTPARKDVTPDASRVAPVVLEVLDFYEQIEVFGDDTFVFDPLPSMQDVTRNAIASMFLGKSASEAAQEIQAEIERNISG